MDLAWKDDILETAHLISIGTGLQIMGYDTKNLPLPSKHLNFILSKRVDSILNQNTINTIYSIYKNSKTIF
jgi:N-acetylmuramoyl-L-alanine amidase